MSFPLINVRFILLTSASFIAIFSSIAIYFCLPLLISHLIRTQITLSPNSGSFGQWRENSILDQIYLYNITNLNDVLSSSEDLATTTGTPIPSTKPSDGRLKSMLKPTLMLHQVGPFTFQQFREKINIVFDPSNETVLYDQKKSWRFLPDSSITKSLGDINTLWINHISVPLAGTTLNPDVAEFVDPVIVENDLRLFLNHSVGSLLFDGYYDLLMEQAKASGHIDVDRFGWMHNQNNSVTRSLRVFTGRSNETLSKFGSIDEFENKKQFQVWHNNNTKPSDYRNVMCNQFSDTSPGEFFPPPKYSLISHNYHLTPRHDEESKTTTNQSSLNNQQQQASRASSTSEQKIISLFMPDLCRTIRLFFNGTHKHKDLSVDRYIANENTYKYWSEGANGQRNEVDEAVIESNKCFCIHNETSQILNCPPNGMMDLFQCKKGSPVTISFPHFLYSQNDPTLKPYLRMFGVEPTGLSEEDYHFFIDLESTLNIPVKVQIVLQFNVHLRNEKQLNFTKDNSFLFEDPNGSGKSLNDFYLPQMWIKSTAEIDDANLENLKFIQQHLNFVTPIATIITVCVASILLMASAKLAYDLTYGPKSTLALDEESCSTTNHQANLCSVYSSEKNQKYLDLQLLKKDNKCCGSTVAESTNADNSSNKATCCDRKKGAYRRVLGLKFGNRSSPNDKEEQFECACGKQPMLLDEATASSRLANLSDGGEMSSKSVCLDGKSHEKDSLEESEPLNR